MAGESARRRGTRHAAGAAAGVSSSAIARCPHRRDATGRPEVTAFRLGMYRGAKPLSSKGDPLALAACGTGCGSDGPLIPSQGPLAAERMSRLRPISALADGKRVRIDRARHLGIYGSKCASHLKGSHAYAEMDGRDPSATVVRPQISAVSQVPETPINATKAQVDAIYTS